MLALSAPQSFPNLAPYISVLCPNQASVDDQVAAVQNKDKLYTSQINSYQVMAIILTNTIYVAGLVIFILEGLLCHLLRCSQTPHLFEDI